MSLFRWDRFLTLAVFKPLQRLALDGNPARTIPILMYHSISDDPETRVSPYYRVCTSPRVFGEQMKSLAAGGYRGVSLETAFAALKQSEPVDRLAVITFDDGFRDFYTAAAPVLKQHDFTATMYLPTAFIGKAARDFKSRPCLIWSEVRELRAAGMEFGSHTVNHPKLYQLAPEQIKAELVDSKQELESELGAPVTNFAYPYAFPSHDRDFVNLFSDLLQQSGYQSNVTTRIGRFKASSAARFTLPRLPVNNADDSALLTAKLAGAYDWLAMPQEFFKRTKQAIRPTRKCTTLPSVKAA